MNKGLWDQICGELKRKLPMPLYHSYVERCTPKKLTSTRIELDFTDSFSKENFEEKCLTSLKESLQTVQLESAEIILSVTPETETRQPEFFFPSTPNSQLLDGKYTFESFIVGTSNQFAHAACQAVAKQPGNCYNPLFIFGVAGLGKTHLLKAIGHQIFVERPFYKILYLTTETFTNELIQAIRLDRMREFREKYRTQCDVLLLDDIQFLAGKERTQEEFFYTFNYLHELKKQIVITSDRYPKEIQGLENRLQTRFEWGLVADVQAPELETRIAILRSKAEAAQIPLPDDVSTHIASYVTTNIRELEGSLHRLQAYASLTGNAITLELAQQILKDIAPKIKHELTPEAVLKLTALHFNVKTTDIRSDKRVRKLSYPRQVCMYLLRKHLLMSFPEIGRFMGGKDHTTVLHAVSKIAELQKTDPEVLTSIASIESLIR